MKRIFLDYFFERRGNLVDAVCAGVVVQMVMHGAWLGALLVFLVLTWISFLGEQARLRELKGGAA